MPNLHFFFSILLLLSIDSAVCDCPIATTLKPMSTGSLTAILNNLSEIPLNKDKIYLYSYSLNEEIPNVDTCKIAISIHGFDGERKQQTFGVNVDLARDMLQQQLLAFKINLFKKEQANFWKSISFSFLISDSQELIVGMKAIYELVSSSNPGQFWVNQTVNSPLNLNNYRSIPKIFISGFQLSKTEVPMNQDPESKKRKIEAKRLTGRYQPFGKETLKNMVNFIDSSVPKFYIDEPVFQSTGSLSFSVNVYSLQLKAFSYSYVIYLEKTNNDIIYQIFSHQFVMKKTEVVQTFDLIKSNRVKIYGLSGLSFPLMDKDKQNDKYTVRFELKTKKLYNSKEIYETQADENLQTIMQFFALELIPGILCKSCSNSPLVYKEFCVSQCPPGHVAIASKLGFLECQLCNIQKFMIPDKNDQNCICADGYYLATTKQNCEKCPYDCLTCFLNICLTCDTPIPSTFRSLNSTTGRCECQAMNSQGLGLFDNFNKQERKCNVCNQRCKTCKGPEIFECLTCPPKRVFSNGYCKCDINYIEDETGQCVCLMPDKLNPYGPCMPGRSQCSENQTLAQLNGESVCECKKDFTRSQYSNRCLRDCPYPQRMSPKSQKCECLEGQIRNPSSSLCQLCESKLSRVYNRELGGCECIGGFVMNKKGECIVCGSKMYYNQRNDECECIFNYFKDKSSNECRKCSSESDGEGCRKISLLGFS